MIFLVLGSCKKETTLFCQKLKNLAHKFYNSVRMVHPLHYLDFNVNKSSKTAYQRVMDFVTHNNDNNIIIINNYFMEPFLISQLLFNMRLKNHVVNRLVLCDDVAVNAIKLIKSLQNYMIFFGNEFDDNNNKLTQYLQGNIPDLMLVSNDPQFYLYNVQNISFCKKFCDISEILFNTYILKEEETFLLFFYNKKFDVLLRIKDNQIFLADHMKELEKYNAKHILYLQKNTKGSLLKKLDLVTKNLFIYDKGKILQEKEFDIVYGETDKMRII